MTSPNISALVGRLEAIARADLHPAAKLCREAGEALRALEAEGTAYLARATEAEVECFRRGQDRQAYWTVLELLCERFPDGPIGDLPGSVDELQRQLEQRTQWLDWAVNELSVLLQSSLTRGMKGSPKSHLEYIAQIRRELSDPSSSPSKPSP